MKHRSLTLALACLLGALCGCGPKNAASSQGAPTAGVITVDNRYAVGCAGKGASAHITAKLDQGPAAAMLDNAKFEFANIAPGAHTLTLAVQGARFVQGFAVWTSSVAIVAGANDTVAITCADGGAVNVALKNAP